MDVTAFILAGGQSTRMGTDKAFVALDGRTLLARMLDVARSLTPDVRIVGDRTKFGHFAPVIEDAFPGCGPLGGIHAALRASRSDLNVILAVDLPLVPPALLQFLASRAAGSSAVVTVPRSAEEWQPLCAVYRRSFADLAEAALRDQQYKIDALFAQTDVQLIGTEELETAGFGERVFRNLNTPQDLTGAF